MSPTPQASLRNNSKSPISFWHMGNTLSLWGPQLPLRVHIPLTLCWAPPPSQALRDLLPLFSIQMCSQKSHSGPVEYEYEYIQVASVIFPKYACSQPEILDTYRFGVLCPSSSPGRKAGHAQRIWNSKFLYFYWFIPLPPHPELGERVYMSPLINREQKPFYFVNKSIDTLYEQKCSMFFGECLNF